MKCYSEDILFNFSLKDNRFMIIINCLKCKAKNDYFLQNYIDSLNNIFIKQGENFCQKEGNVHMIKIANYFCKTCNKMFS